MSFSVRVVPLILLALLSVAIPLRAQAPAKPTAAKVPRGVLDGRVPDPSAGPSEADSR